MSVDADVAGVAAFQYPPYSTSGSPLSLLGPRQSVSPPPNSPARGDPSRRHSLPPPAGVAAAHDADADCAATSGESVPPAPGSAAGFFVTTQEPRSGSVVTTYVPPEGAGGSEPAQHLIGAGQAPPAPEVMPPGRYVGPLPLEDGTVLTGEGVRLLSPDGAVVVMPPGRYLGPYPEEAEGAAAGMLPLEGTAAVAAAAGAAHNVSLDDSLPVLSEYFAAVQASQEAASQARLTRGSLEPLFIPRDAAASGSGGGEYVSHLHLHQHDATAPASVPAAAAVRAGSSSLGRTASGEAAAAGGLHHHAAEYIRALCAGQQQQQQQYLPQQTSPFSIDESLPVPQRGSIEQFSTLMGGGGSVRASRRLSAEPTLHYPVHQAPQVHQAHTTHAQQQQLQQQQQLPHKMQRDMRRALTRTELQPYAAFLKRFAPKEPRVTNPDNLSTTGDSVAGVLPTTLLRACTPSGPLPTLHAGGFARFVGGGVMPSTGAVIPASAEADECVLARGDALAVLEVRYPAAGDPSGIPTLLVRKASHPEQNAFLLSFDDVMAI